MRDSYFDNLKGILILLVVIGHFILPMEKTRPVWGIFYTIYLFHMPMFAMISGYFSKGMYRDGKFHMERFLRILWLYIVFKLAVHVTENLAAGTSFLVPIDFLYESGSPWYLFAMMWWYLSIPFANMFKPKAVLIGAFALSILSGYQPSLGYGLAMGRTLAFLPFFYAGYYMKKEQVDNFRNAKWKWIFAVCAAGIAGALILGNQGLFGSVERFVYGLNYWETNAALLPWCGLIRAAHYGLVLLMVLGIMAVTTSKKTILTGIGMRTLPIYILHRLLRDMMQYWGFYEAFPSQYRRNVVFTIGLAVLATYILGMPWSDAVFKKLQRVPDWCYARWRKSLA